MYLQTNNTLALKSFSWT